MVSYEKQKFLSLRIQLLHCLPNAYDTELNFSSSSIPYLLFFNNNLYYKIYTLDITGRLYIMIDYYYYDCTYIMINILFRCKIFILYTECHSDYCTLLYLLIHNSLSIFIFAIFLFAYQQLFFLYINVFVTLKMYHTKMYQAKCTQTLCQLDIQLIYLIKYYT